MIIDCISDLHGYKPLLEGGDLLIIAGDLTARDTKSEYADFLKWLDPISFKYKKIILIAGNHDGLIKKYGTELLPGFCTYLQDSGCDFQGLKIWGSPWTKSFSGMNPHCKAFTCDTDEDLEKKWELFPDDIDILITHSPPYGYFDYVIRNHNCGSVSLRNHVMNRIKPKLHVFGHIHEWGGRILDTNITKFVNASHVNEYYEPVNEPVRIIL